MKRLLNRLKNNRIVYLIYFIKSTNWQKLSNDSSFVSKKYNRSKFALYADMVFTSISLGSSFHEYFYYSFFNKTKKERAAYATMAYMYEYQLRNNPVSARSVLEDKLIFFDKYRDFLGRDILNCKLADDEDLKNFIRGRAKAVLKKSKGGGGKNVEVINLDAFTFESLKSYIENEGYDIIEEFVIQHDDLMALSPNSLNTIRLITQLLPNNEVAILGTVLRMGIDKQTDNLSSGGIACSVDTDTGMICDNGVSFNIAAEDYTKHPVSNISFVGFKIPYWEKVKHTCITAAKLDMRNKSIGWDVAISNEGPMLIEGNHDWGARVWQMPVKKGLKHKLNS